MNSGKNSPIMLLLASVALANTVTFFDISQVEEVEQIIRILRSIGVVVTWNGPHTLLVDSTGPLSLESIDREACRATRASLLLFGALSARVKTYRLYKSGGCKLGERTIHPHVFALQKLGVQITSEDNYYLVKNNERKAARIVMYESGDTATGNAILVAVFTPGQTTITFASANYMVQELCHFLVAAGANIKGIGTTTLIITGVKKLHEVKKYSIAPDPVEAMTWLALAVTTKSPLTIRNCPIDFIELELEKLSVMGQRYTIKNERLSRSQKFRIVDIDMIPSKLTALPDKIYGRPYPGLNIDSLPFFVPVLTQASGRTLVHDWVYETRALYQLVLQKLGAKVMLLDPHRLFVEGVTPLIGNEIDCPPAIRPAMAILIAMCAAKGKSVLRAVEPIERGYEDIVPRLQAVGVDIKRFE